MSTELVQADAGIEGVKIDYAKVLAHLKLNPSDPKAQALVLVCRQYNLDPVLKHALIVDGDLYITHKGLLHVAHLSGVYDGSIVLAQGETDTHWTATVQVWRSDKTRPWTFPGRYPKLRDVNEWRDGPNGKRVKVKIGEEEHPHGPEMAIKTSECAGLRRAFDVAMSVAEERWDMEQPATSVSRLPQDTGPQGSPVRGRQAPADPVHTSGPGKAGGAAPGPDQTPASGLGPPGPLAGPTPGAPAASGGPQAPQQVPSTPAAEAATVDSKSLDLFRSVCETFGIKGTRAIEVLNDNGWDLPVAWREWQATVAGWSQSQVMSAANTLEKALSAQFNEPQGSDAA